MDNNWTPNTELKQLGKQIKAHITRVAKAAPITQLLVSSETAH